jgi:hypothetical protein
MSMSLLIRILGPICVFATTLLLLVAIMFRHPKVCCSRVVFLLLPFVCLLFVYGHVLLLAINAAKVDPPPTQKIPDMATPLLVPDTGTVVYQLVWNGAGVLLLCFYALWECQLYGWCWRYGLPLASSLQILGGLILCLFLKNIFLYAEIVRNCIWIIFFFACEFVCVSFRPPTSHALGWAMALYYALRAIAALALLLTNTTLAAIATILADQCLVLLYSRALSCFFRRYGLGYGYTPLSSMRARKVRPKKKSRRLQAQNLNRLPLVPPASPCYTGWQNVHIFQPMCVPVDCDGAPGLVVWDSPLTLAELLMYIKEDVSIGSYAKPGSAANQLKGLRDILDALAGARAASQSKGILQQVSLLLASWPAADIVSLLYRAAQFVEHRWAGVVPLQERITGGAGGVVLTHRRVLDFHRAQIWFKSRLGHHRYCETSAGELGYFSRYLQMLCTTLVDQGTESELWEGPFVSFIRSAPSMLTAVCALDENAKMTQLPVRRRRSSSVFGSLGFQWKLSTVEDDSESDEEEQEHECLPHIRPGHATQRKLDAIHSAGCRKVALDYITRMIDHEREFTDLQCLNFLYHELRQNKLFSRLVLQFTWNRSAPLVLFFLAASGCRHAHTWATRPCSAFNGTTQADPGQPRGKYLTVAPPRPAGLLRPPSSPTHIPVSPRHAASASTIVDPIERATVKLFVTAMFSLRCYKTEAMAQTFIHVHMASDGAAMEHLQCSMTRYCAQSGLTNAFLPYARHGETLLRNSVCPTSQLGESAAKELLPPGLLMRVVGQIWDTRLTGRPTLLPVVHEIAQALSLDMQAQLATLAARFCEEYLSSCPLGLLYPGLPNTQVGQLAQGAMAMVRGGAQDARAAPDGAKVAAAFECFVLLVFQFLYELENGVMIYQQDQAAVAARWTALGLFVDPRFQCSSSLTRRQHMHLFVKNIWQRPPQLPELPAGSAIDYLLNGNAELPAGSAIDYLLNGNAELP